MNQPNPTIPTVWVLCGGPSTEYEVSVSSGRFVCLHADKTRFAIRPVVVTRSRRWIISERTATGTADNSWIDEFFATAVPTGRDDTDQSTGYSLHEALQLLTATSIDCAFLAFHGQYGEDGGIQGLLQTAQVPYTGSGILASALAYNKAASLDIFAKAGLPVARSVVCTPAEPRPAALQSLSFPVFTKPVCGGSSLGVSLVKKPEDLEAGIRHALDHDDRCIVEEKIEGVEVSCGVLDEICDGQIISRALPPTLIAPTEAEFFDYDAKYVPGKSRDTTPAPLPAQLIDKIQSIALQAHHALYCEGMSRTDMITLPDADAQPYILETQTLPGMTPTSLIPLQCQAAGIEFSQFITMLISHALTKNAPTGSDNG